MANEVKEKSSHHHHHHHHHKSSKKKTKFSLKRFVRKYKLPLRIAALVIVAALTVTATVIIVKQADQLRTLSQDNSTITPVPTQTIPESHLAVTVTRFDEAVSLTHQTVQTYLSASLSTSAADIVGPVLASGHRLDRGQPVSLSFSVLGLAANCNVTGFRVEVTEQGQKTPAYAQDLGAGQSSVLLYNLKTGTTYSFTVRADFTAMPSITVSGAFDTAAGPRLLFVDGIGNVRDFGGWKVGNTYINQGLLYRGSELDGSGDAQFNLSDTGRQTLVTNLGIHAILDLRSPEETSGVNVVGGGTTLTGPYNAPYYDAAFTTGKDAMARIFTELADESNYPIYMHCTFGRDRTGTVCLILGALLGMSEADLLREYGLSAMYYGDADYTNPNLVLAGLKTFEGENLAQQAENYLRSIGITDDQIDAIRHIYLG